MRTAKTEFITYEEFCQLLAADLKGMLRMEKPEDVERYLYGEEGQSLAKVRYKGLVQELGDDRDENRRLVRSVISSASYCMYMMY